MRWLCLLLVACSSAAPCEPQDLVDCPQCSAGEARRVIAMPGAQYLNLFTAGGDARAFCWQCARVWEVENADLPSIAIDDGKDSEVSAAAGAPDGTVYVVADQVVPSPALRASYQLVAIAPSGAIAWQLPLDAPPADTVLEYQLVAAAEGPYLLLSDVHGAISVTAFDTQGATRWQSSIVGAIASDGRGGLYVGTRAYLEEPGPVTAQLELRDASGAVVRKHVLKTTGVDFDTLLEIDQIAATADGGAMVVGQFHGDRLDLGDFTLAPTITGGSSFIAAFDASGATLWAHAFDKLGNVTLVARGPAALVSGDYMDGGGSLGLPATQGDDLAVLAFDANGPRDLHTIRGRVGQINVGIAPAPDGAVWLSLFKWTEQGAGATELVVGSQTFDTDNGNWAFVVELAL